MNFRELFAVNGLSLERLRALVAVDDAGNIAAVAPTDRNRQSQLSRQLGELEKFFETELKRTEGRTARLTNEGKALAALAREHLQSLNEFRTGVKKQPLTVSLAAGSALHEWVVLPRMAQLRAAAGKVIWLLPLRKNAVMCQQLLDGSLDFALLRSDLLKNYAPKRKQSKQAAASTKPVLVGAPLGTINYSVFVPEALCGRARNLSLPAILDDLPIATQGDDTKFQLALETALAKRKLRLNAAVYGESFTQVAQMVAGGTMAGILPDIAANAFDPARVWRAPLNWDELRREISLAWNPGRHGRLIALEKLRPQFERVLRF